MSSIRNFTGMACALTALLYGCGGAEGTTSGGPAGDPPGDPASPPSQTPKGPEGTPSSGSPMAGDLCPAPSCTGAPCEAATVATFGATVASLSSDGDTLYALLWQQDTYGKILAQPLYAVAKDRTTKQLHANLPYQEAVVKNGALFAVSLPTAGGGKGHQRVESRSLASLDTPKVLAQELEVPRWGLAATRDRVYFGVAADASSPFPDTTVMGLSPSGGAPTNLGTTRRGDAWAADDSDVFVADSDAHALLRFPVSGGASVKVAPLDRAATALTLAGDARVHAVVEGTGVTSAPRSGGPWTELVHGSFRGLTARDGAVFFGEGKTLRCARVPIND